MDLVAAIRLYVNEMVRIVGPGMKVLLMDSETISIISSIFAQSEVMTKEVYLFERIDNKMAVREPIRYLKCIAFLRPTQENVELLKEELKNPKYAQYYLYFSNVISKNDVKLLAEADEQEVVREVQEMYADFVAVHSHLFSLFLHGCYSPIGQKSNFASTAHHKRCTEGLAAVCLALKKSPVIRYQSKSGMAKQLADSLNALFSREDSLFTFRRSSESAPLLLILDRKDDPVTPLLNQWTYQAMVHELLGLKNNRVDLRGVPGVSKDMQEVVLNPFQDEFYAKNLHSNFAEIGLGIKELMDDFQRKSQTHKRLESIGDMKAFVEQYPQFKKMSGAVAKHVTVVGELSRLVKEGCLLDLSETEQLIACHDEHSQTLQNIKRLLENGSITHLDKTRLVMLYALRYEKHQNNDKNKLINELKIKNVPEKYWQAVEQILAFGGSDRRSSDLFGSADNPMAITRKFIKGLKGVENVYTQHQPYLSEILDQLLKAKLNPSVYPYFFGALPVNRVQEVIIFIIGGVTYEESLTVHNFNKANAASGVKVILGGTCIHNTQSFIGEISSFSIENNQFGSTNRTARSHQTLM